MILPSMTANNLTTSYKHSIDKSVNSMVNRFKQVNAYNENVIPTSLNEVLNIVYKLKPSKSPGFDGISNLLIKQLPEIALRLLVIIFNSCLHLNYFPQNFKIAKVTAIQKPNKPKSDPGSYRSISLLSNISKLYEKLIYSRISDYVLANSLISNEQFGFKREHSSVHQIHRIKNIIINNKHKRHSTGLILLDNWGYNT